MVYPKIYAEDHKTVKILCDMALTDRLEGFVSETIPALHPHWSVALRFLIEMGEVLLKKAILSGRVAGHSNLY